MKIGNAWIRTALILVGAVALHHADAAERLFQVGVGIHLDGNGYPFYGTENTLNSTGLTFRDDMRWSRLELTEGELAVPKSYFDLDNLIADAHAHQKRPVLLLVYGNKLYDDGGQISSPQGIAAYTKYARFVVNHFKGQVDQFEIWNEWIYGAGASPNQKVKGDPVQYANLLRSTYEGIKQENPNAIVLGGVTGVGDVDSTWFGKFAAAGGLNYLDAVAFHPYVQCYAPSRPVGPEAAGAATAAPAGGNVPVTFGSPEFSLNMLEKFHDSLVKSLPARQIPIYVTEVGWPTGSGKCAVPDSVQAAFLQRFYLEASTKPWIAGAWWYDLTDDGIDPTNAELNFGLQKNNGMPKPGFPALTALVNLLNTEQVPTFTKGPAGEYVVSGKMKNGNPFVAAWLPTNIFSMHAPWPLGVQLLGSGYKVIGPQQLTNGSLGAVPVILAKP